MTLDHQSSHFPGGALASHMYDAFSLQQTAYSNKCTHCEYSACISEPVLICVTKRDIQIPACSQYALPLAIIRVTWTWLGMAMLPELRPLISICHIADVREGLLERFVFECTVKGSSLLVEKNTHHDRVIT